MRLKVDEELCVEWRGRWMKAVVTQVDCSLVGVGIEWYCITVGPQPLPLPVQVLFVESRMHEWLYRGSTRLEPIFLALVSVAELECIYVNSNNVLNSNHLITVYAVGLF